MPSEGLFFKLPVCIASRSDLSWSAKGVYCVVADAVRREGRCRIGWRQLAALVGVDKMTVARALDGLAAAGLIIRERGPAGTATAYRLPGATDWEIQSVGDSIRTIDSDATDRETQSLDRPQNAVAANRADCKTQSVDRPRNAVGRQDGGCTHVQDRPHSAPAADRKTQSPPTAFCTPPETPIKRRELLENSCAASGRRHGKAVNLSEADKVTIPPGLNTPGFQTAWREWLSYRRECRKPIRPSTAKRQLQELATNLPEIAIAMIEQSIRCGWQGLFDLKTGPAQGSGVHRMQAAKGRPEDYDAVVERV